jgi:hypothetical protein
VPGLSGSILDVGDAVEATVCIEVEVGVACCAEDEFLGSLQM